MKAFKFLIPESAPRLLPDKSFFVAGMMAVVLAEDVEGAKAALTADALLHGDDPRWLDIATVIEIDLKPGVVLAWVAA